MNITPLYELRNRLKNCMIAGTNLISEDFRLKRAVEGIAPFAKAAPVFAKIAEQAQKLLEPEQENREALLLDVITLLDAVFCTQALVSVNEEQIPFLPQHSGTCLPQKMPYSLVKPLVDALTQSGSGRFAYVQEIHEEYPQLFEDYRVRAAMVKALGASYSELVNLVEVWLKAQGEEIVWLLMADFDPKGKKEMVRRVRLIESVCGAKANDFYLRMLPEAEKEVRLELIHALGDDPGNVEQLLLLAQTEPKAMRKMVFCTLAAQPDEAAAAPFRKMIAKKPKEVFEFLYLSQTEWASDLLAECMKQKLDEWEKNAAETGISTFKNPEDEEWWSKLLPALIGKHGTAIEEAILQAVDLSKKLNLSGDKYRNKVKLPRYDGVYREGSISLEQGLAFENALAYILAMSLKVCQDEGLYALAMRLYERDGISEEHNLYFEAAAVGNLFKSENYFAWIKQQTKGLPNRAKILAEAMKGTVYDETGWCMISRFYHPITERTLEYTMPISQRLEDGVTELLIGYQDSDVDEVLAHMVHRANPEFCAKAEPYFYKKALTCSTYGELQYYADILKRCGCTRCKDLFIKCAQVTKDFWSLWYFCKEAPGSGEEKAQEAERVWELVRKGSLNLKNGDRLMAYEQSFMQLINQFKEEKQ